MSRPALDRARAGDDQAFRELIDPHTHELQLHCYRMLGSLVDAEDVLQETLTAAWRGLSGFDHRSTLRTWLYSIATNRCLNAIRDSRRRMPVEPVPPFDPPPPSRRGEVTWLQPCPDTWLDRVDHQAPDARYERRETVELAFIAALQRLPARQTAAVLLADVLGFSSAEVATMLKTTPASVKGVLQRGRASLDQHSRHHDAPRPGSAQEQQLARRFADAFSDDDVDGVVALLTDDAWLAMPPAPHEYHGPSAIAEFLRVSTRARGGPLQLVATRANTQPAFVCYLADPAAPASLVVLTLSGDRISAITRFLDDGVQGFFTAHR